MALLVELKQKVGPGERRLGLVDLALSVSLHPRCHEGLRPHLPHSHHNVFCCHRPAGSSNHEVKPLKPFLLVSCLPQLFCNSNVLSLGKDNQIPVMLYSWKKTEAIWSKVSTLGSCVQVFSVQSPVNFFSSSLCFKKGGLFRKADFN